MRKLLTLTLLLLPLVAQANPPAELRQVFHSKAPYSEAKLTFAWMDVYHIALWTDAAAWKPDTRYALSITYDMAFSAEELVERTCEEMARHYAEGKAICLARKNELMRLMPDVLERDRITALHTESGHVRFYKNGKATGEITDAQFTRAFFAIWLGENTSEPKLRRQLLRQE